MENYFGAARNAFQENLREGQDTEKWNLYAGLVALASGLEVEIKEIKARLSRLESGQK